MISKKTQLPNLVVVYPAYICQIEEQYMYKKHIIG